MGYTQAPANRRIQPHLWSFETDAFGRVYVAALLRPAGAAPQHVVYRVDQPETNLLDALPNTPQRIRERVLLYGAPHLRWRWRDGQLLVGSVNRAGPHPTDDTRTVNIEDGTVFLPVPGVFLFGVARAIWLGPVPE